MRPDPAAHVNEPVVCNLKVIGYVDDAKKRGCDVLCGGKRLEGAGYFYEPTIVSNIKEGTKLWDEEQARPPSAASHARPRRL